MPRIGSVALVVCVLSASSLVRAQEKEQKETKAWPVKLEGPRDTITITSMTHVAKDKRDPERVRITRKHNGKTDTLEIAPPTWGPPAINPPNTVTTSLSGEEYDPRKHQRVQIPYHLHVKCPKEGNGEGEISWGTDNSGEIAKAKVSHDQQEAIKKAIGLLKLPERK